ncbi:MAG: hypothetical protein JO228_08830 [Xanthobacteraceae bacterium]|nr:hypothetical protein [Xanthobacteraceae bacterium]
MSKIIGTLVVTLMLSASSSGAGLAASYQDGQQPASPSLAARMALPACGFAATESWGANGYQLCDARNIYGQSHR